MIPEPGKTVPEIKIDPKMILGPGELVTRTLGQGELVTRILGQGEM